MYKVYITGPGDDDFKDLPDILGNINVANQTIISTDFVNGQWYVVVQEPFDITIGEGFSNNDSNRHLHHEHRSLNTIEGEVEDEVC